MKRGFLRKQESDLRSQDDDEEGKDANEGQSNGRVE